VWMWVRPVLQHSGTARARVRARVFVRDSAATVRVWQLLDIVLARLHVRGSVYDCTRWYDCTRCWVGLTTALDGSGSESMALCARLVLRLRHRSRAQCM
jgi:hypothetical protein